MKGGILNRIGFKAFESFSAKHYNFIIYYYNLSFISRKRDFNLSDGIMDISEFP